MLNLYADEPLGSLDAFELRFSNAADDPLARKTLSDRASPYRLRKSKEECLDLPGKMFADLLTELPPW